MCGIVGYKGFKKCLPILIDGLKKLEYRGYDSSGVSYIAQDQLITFKSVGCVQSLIDNYIDYETESTIGIAHTRWATHGHPSVKNAHPHSSLDGRLSLVHNGIIENYLVLKNELKDKGYYFLSDTDSEVLLYLIYDYLIYNKYSLFEATKLALKRVVGAYAIAVLDNKNPNTMVVARRGSPLVIGNVDNKEFYVCSDSRVLTNYTKSVLILEDNTVAEITDCVVVHNLKSNSVVECDSMDLSMGDNYEDKGDFDHFMIKEIYEQPRVVEDCLRGRLDNYHVKLGGLEDFKDRFKKVSSITILACGSSYYAGLIGKYYFEEFCNIRTNVEYASEFIYRKPVLDHNDMVLCISQSGETADLLNAVTICKNRGVFVVGVCNVVNSSLVRLTDCGVFCRAGLEVGVASTKTFVAQVVVLLMIALWIDQANDYSLINEYRIALIEELKNLPKLIEEVLKLNKKVRNLAAKYHAVGRCLFIGREYSYPVALEGALKLKEVSYMNTEGYAAAEMKHGPLALIDKNCVVIAIANNSKQYDKMNNSIKEIDARNGKVIKICDDKQASGCDITLPHTIDPLCPVLSVVVLQLFAYYCSVLKGYNVDKPRNLAKSVTVE